MGFFEDDRIRKKNWEWNFPTPDVNFRARQLLKNYSQLQIVSMRENALFAHDDDAAAITTTALQIIEKDIK